MIRVLLADDHAMVRAGLEELLRAEDDIEVVATVGDGEQAVAGVAELMPDVILLDLSMPVLDGIEATVRILAADPEARVVILTASAGHDQIMGAIDAGALGYLLKDAAPEELLGGIRAAARGEAPLDPKAARAVLADRHDRPTTQPDLSDREREVLGLVAQGMANKLIASRLEISEKTVKAHLTRVYEQLGVSDRTQAAIWARDHGIGPG